jgi:hypothetical protein
MKLGEEFTPIPGTRLDHEGWLLKGSTLDLEGLRLGIDFFQEHFNHAECDYAGVQKSAKKWR